MYNFNYILPNSLTEASELLVADAEAKLIAGGQTLIPALKQRLAQPSTLIDLKSINGLSGIKDNGNSLVVKAMTSHTDVATSTLVRSKISALSFLAGSIGDPAVRNLGTIGGSVANNDPVADYPAALLGLGATVHTNQRVIIADDFFMGQFTTALKDGEIITEIIFPKPKRAAYQKFSNLASRYAIVGAFVAQMEAGVRVAITGAGSTGVFRLPSFEQALTDSFPPDIFTWYERDR